MNHARDAVEQPLAAFDCEQTVRRLWDYLDEQLGPVDLAMIDAHLAECDRCPPHFAFERRFLEAVREARAGVETPDRAKIKALRERVVARLIAEGEIVSPRGPV